MPAVKTEVFQKTFASAPQEISAPIIALSRSLNTKSKPVWVATKSEAGAIINECFNNVSTKVARDGGSLVYGWAIWEWPRVFIEAEHHAVWEKDGELLDITPHINGEPKILFLPDPTRIYDFQGKKRLINVKRNLGVFASVDRWIAASDNLQRAIEEHSIGDEIRINRSQLKALAENARHAQAQVLIDLASNTKVNEPCFCSSSKKFKRCCALLIDLTYHG